MTQPARALFLDRDGVITVEGGRYVTSPDDLCFLPGALEALALLKQHAVRVMVFTNQAGVGRGELTLHTLEAIHDRMRRETEKAGGCIEAVYACPHAPEANCMCRKPLPGMLLQAARERRLNLAECMAAGDSPRDIAAGSAAGCRTALVLSGHTEGYLPAHFPSPQPDAVYAHLHALAEAVCSGTDGWPLHF